MATTTRATRTPEQTTALLKEIRDRYDAGMEAWRTVRDEAKTDMRYVSGDPWEPKDRETRKNAGRPCLSLDELGQYFNQVINDVRANPRAVKFSPTGNGANDKTAEFYADKMREIEYRSHAQIAYTTAFENAVHRSYGWLRLATEYRSPRAMTQEIVIRDIPNPDMVIADPESTRPDSSDMRWLFHFERWKQSEFSRRFPKAAIQSFEEYRGEAPAWVQDSTIVVAEYWRVESERKRLLLLSDGSTVFEDERAKAQPPALRRVAAAIGLAAPAPAAPEVVDSRDVDVPRVRMYLTNGLEILEEHDWAGKAIPFVSCYGKILYVDSGKGAERTIMSMTRLARDPYMLYCYYRTGQSELVGMTPKFPYFVYEGQLDPTELVNLQKSLHEPVAVIRVRPYVEGMPPGTPLPPPSRQPYEPPIAALEMGAEAARRAIQAAMGISPLPTSAQRRNEKSGIALQQIEESQQRGTFHFVDHYDDMIRRVGELTEDLIDKVYDTPQDVGIRDKNEQAKIVRINDPADPESIPTQGDHLVTISTGPSFESERTAGMAFADSIVQNLPNIAAISGPQAAASILAKAIKLQNIGTIGDDIADIIRPQPIQNPDGSPPTPEQLQQALAQSQGQLQQMQQQMAEMGKALETDQIKAQRDLEIEQARQAAETERARVRAEFEMARAAEDNAAKLQLERMKIVSTLLQTQAKLDMQKAEMQVDAALRQLDTSVGVAGAEADREFQREQGAEGRSFEADQAERARQAAAQSSEAGA
jgi:hypothetical protein